MPTIEAKSTVNPARACPLCSSTLDETNPSECPMCDWHVGYEKPSDEPGNPRDLAAVLMSVVPGLGHIYKGHPLSGALYMLGAAFALVAAVVASTATAGFGVLLLPLYWAGVMLQVYWLEDRALVKAQG